MRETIQLNEDIMYPLYEPEEQIRRYEKGEQTHKSPADMNRKERRTVIARMRKRFRSLD